MFGLSFEAGSFRVPVKVSDSGNLHPNTPNVFLTMIKVLGLDGESSKPSAGTFELCFVEVKLFRFQVHFL